MKVAKPSDKLKEPILVKTFVGDLEVDHIYHNSLGYFAVTEEGLSQRTWNITAAEFEDLKNQLEANKNG